MRQLCSLLSLCVATTALAQDRYTNYYAGGFKQSGPAELTDSGLANISISIQFQPGNFTSSAVKPPPAPGFMPMSSSTTNFFLGDSALSFADLIAAYPGGDYLYNLSGGSLGTRTVTNTIPDLAAFQGADPIFTVPFWNIRTTLDASGNITVSWTPFVSNPADFFDQLLLTLRPVPSAFQPSILVQTLPSSQSSFTIPASTLTITRDYIITLTRVRIAATTITNDPGAIGALQIDKSTTILIRTGANQCSGDINHDGIVDDSDFTLFVVPYNILDCFDFTMPSGCDADLNGDGVVDDADFSLFIVNYNNLLCPE